MANTRFPHALGVGVLVAGLLTVAPTAHAGDNDAILQLESATMFDFGVINTVGFGLETSVGWGRWESRWGIGWFDYSDNSLDPSDLALGTTRYNAHLRYNMLQKRCRKCTKLGVRFSNWIEAGVGRKDVKLYDRHGTAFSNNVIEDGSRPEFSLGIGAGVFMRGAIGISLSTRWNVAPATHAEEMLLGGGPVSSYQLMLGLSLNPL
jgi:hypothetical protein